jgi:hypothetical protein
MSTATAVFGELTTVNFILIELHGVVAIEQIPVSNKSGS